MKRRTFIISAAAATTVAAIPFAKWICNAAHPHEWLSTPDMLSRFCDEDTLHHIGRNYIACVPAECKKDKLRKLLLTDEHGHSLKLSSSSQKSEWISRRITQDFTAQRTIVIDGWILSVTEARQCALLSLS